jgi:hypothetical protein
MRPEQQAFILQQFQVFPDGNGRNVQLLAEFQYVDKAFLAQFTQNELMSFSL